MHGFGLDVKLFSYYLLRLDVIICCLLSYISEVAKVNDNVADFVYFSILRQFVQWKISVLESPIV